MPSLALDRGPSAEGLRAEPRAWLLPTALSAGLAAWSAWFIWRTSFVADGRRVFCLFDDAMISMAYARNLVEGHGLNWARWGAPVEGFTHPLWLALMVPIHWLPLARVHASLAVQVVSAICLVLDLWMIRRLVRRHFSTPGQAAWWPAAVMTAVYYPLDQWALQGMETGLQALLLVTTLCLVFDYRDGRAGPLPAFVLFTLCLLLRMDMAIVVAPCLVFLSARPPRAEHRRAWRAGWAIPIGACAAYEVFRWLYFGDLLPNTYYLKMTGVPAPVRVFHGLLVFLDFAAPLAWPLVALAVGLAPHLTRRPKLALSALIVALGFAYSIWVGGDAWEWSTVGANRFIAWVMPLVFVLINALLNLGLEARSAAGRRHPLSDSYGRAAITVLCAVWFDGLWLSPQAEAHREDLVVAARPLRVGENAKVFRRLSEAGRILEPGALVATIWAGIPAYFSDYRMLDLFGYNDAHIAKVTSPVPLSVGEARAYDPGHMKWDYDYALGRVRPDLVFQVWGPSDADSTALLQKYGYGARDGFWVRLDSDQVRPAP